MQVDPDIPRLLLRAERADALLAVTKLLSEAVDDPRALAEMIADRIAHLAGDAVTVWLLPAGLEDFEGVATAHPDPMAAEMLAQMQGGVDGRDSGIVDPVFKTGDRLVIADFDMRHYKRDIAEAYWPWLERYGISSLTVLPMRVRGRVVGAVGTSRDLGRPPYSEDDVEFMQALADCAAIAIGNAHLLRAATTAQDSLRRQSELVDQVSDAIMSIDRGSRITSWNAAAEAIYGRRASEVIGQPVNPLLKTVFLDVDGNEISRTEFLRQRDVDGFWRGETRERHADGHVLELLCSTTVVPGANGQIAGYVSVNRDLTAQRAASREALHDPLTGLPNRRLLMDRLTLGLARATRRKSQLALLFVDLDGFKLINDRYGHSEGDVILRTCARRLLGAMRASDTVTRLGGDEFIVLAEDLDAKAGAVYGARILDCLRVGVPIRGEFVTIGASVGIALSQPGEGAEALVAKADAAMYSAKRAGKGQWHLYTTTDSPLATMDTQDTEPRLPA